MDSIISYSSAKDSIEEPIKDSNDESIGKSEIMRIFDIEAAAILALKDRIDAPFFLALDFLSACKGKVIVTGMGKSGHIGRKISSTLSSTGTPSVFVHPAESAHGDLGVIGADDVIIAISYAGESDELDNIVRFAHRRGIKIIALTGNIRSRLSKAAATVIDVSVAVEACPLGLAPTASAVATLAMGDALAMALVRRKGFRQEDFAEFHPGGSLGRKLLTRVRDVMRVESSIPLVRFDSDMREVIATMTGNEVRGIAGVINDLGNLIGVITDGDLRRRLDKSLNPLSDKAEDIMSSSPKTIGAEELAERALFLMEKFAILSLFVVNTLPADDPESPLKATGHPIGIVHLHDLLKAKIR